MCTRTKRARAHAHGIIYLNLLKFTEIYYIYSKTFTYLFGCGSLSINNLKFNKILDYTTAHKTAFREKAGKPKTE